MESLAIITWFHNMNEKLVARMILMVPAIYPNNQYIGAIIAPLALNMVSFYVMKSQQDSDSEESCQGGFLITLFATASKIP